MNRINRPYVRDIGRNFTPVYMPGETYSFYFNCDNFLSDPSVAYFQLRLLDAQGNTVYNLNGFDSFGTGGIIYPYAPSSVLYHIWKRFVFPPVKNGQYFFQIYDFLNGIEKSRSNLILCSNDCVDRTCIIKFRHHDNIYNTFYNLLPTNFYQTFRLPLSQTDLQFLSSREEYRQSSNGRNLRIGKSFRDQKLTIEAYWFDDEAHQALSAALEHSDIWIDGYKVLNVKQLTVERSTAFSNLTKGNFEILLDEFNVDPLNIDGYGEFLLYGGDAPAFISSDTVEST